MVAILLVAICAATSTPDAVHSCSYTINGCYVDTMDRLISDLQLSITTLEDCAYQCFIRGFEIFGAEDGSQCFCGHKFNPVVPVVQAPMSACQMPCPYNSSEPCGGVWRVVVGSPTNCSYTPNYRACLTPASSKFAFCNASLPVDDRIEDLMSRLTLPEKIAMFSPMGSRDSCECFTGGIDRLDVPAWMWLTETNSGVASTCVVAGKCPTAYPGPLGLGASFNRTVWTIKGSVIGTEIRAFSNIQWKRGAGGPVAVTGFGPNINIVRDPRFGRNSELPSEDPVLSGTLAAAMVQGMQERDSNGYPKMLAFLKHFTAYSTEANRGHDTYDISPHDLHDTYLAQYEIAFTQGHASGVMCSYNAINGVPSCANDYILNKVMRGQWNQSDAIVTSDCGAVSNLRGPPVNAATDTLAAAMAFNNGTDIEMGSTEYTYFLEDAVNAGLVSIDRVETSARRVLKALFKLGRFDPVGSSSWDSLDIGDISRADSLAAVYDAALQSAVLLKNDGVLPLRPGCTVAVIGPQASAKEGLLDDYPGGDEMCAGGGYDCMVSIGEAVRRANTGGATLVADGITVDTPDTKHMQAALDLIAFADVVVLALGITHNNEHEGQDRTDTALPGIQEPFAQLVFSQNKPVVLVLTNGGALAIDNLINTSNAIVEAFNPSTYGALALGDLLFGKTNRWGKLPVTMYPHDYIAKQPMTNYDMARYPGRTYRYYQDTPLFPFGFGLSYTTFAHTCKISSDYSVTCVVTNTGHRDGDEVVMVHHAVSDDIRSHANHPIPIKALVDFDRVSVPAGGHVTLSFHLTTASFAVVNADGIRVVYPGEHSIIVSRGVGVDVVLTVELNESLHSQA